MDAPGLIAAFALVGLLAAAGLSFLARGTPVERIRVIGDGEDIAPAIETPLFRETFALLTNTTFFPNNRVEVLLNGDGTYERLLEDLRVARELITWQVFWFRPGRLAEQVREALEERARAGVRVLFLVDYIGTGRLRRGYLDGLRAAGVEVAWFRPLGWRTFYKVQQRSHCRSVVIDGRVGYTGGFGIDDKWLGDGRHPGQWRETSVRLQGPVVDQLRVAFVSNWAESTGQLLLGDHVFHLEDNRRAGEQEAGLLYAEPTLGSTNAERFFAVSIAGARRRLFITNPYFIPDDDFRRFLVEAAARGVDVRVLTPGRNTDERITYWAGRAHYEELLEGGVRVYEYRPTMVHAKTLVADGCWSAVGTINFDNRSMALNDEVAVVIRDEAVARRLEAIFLEDLEHAEELTLERFRSRPRLERAAESASLPLARFL